MDDSHRHQRIQTVCLLIVATVAAAYALVWLKPVLIPFVLAMFFTIALTPLVDLQTRYLRFPRAVSAGTTLLLGVGVMFLIGLIVSISVGELLANVDDYQRRLIELRDQSLDLFGPAPVPATAPASSAATAATASAPASQPQDEAFLAWLKIDRAEVEQAFSRVPMNRVGPLLRDTATGILDVASQGALVLIFMCFLLFGKAREAPQRGGVLGEVERQVRHYVGAKVGVSLITGVLVAAILSILGVPMAMAFGLMAFLLNFIPNVGSVIATLLPLPIVLLSDDISTASAILAIALPGAVQFTVGNVIEPRIMGKSSGLHPITILMALIVWGMLWGIVGMFLAVPITAVVRILLARSPVTAPVARVMAGQTQDLEHPPLT